MDLGQSFSLLCCGGCGRVVGMKRFFLPAAAVLCLAACTQTKDFTIRTLPEGARITINGRSQEGCTPMTVEIKQDRDLGITAFKPGYEVASATVETQTGFWHALLWNKNDPRARFIDEDEITIPMKKIPSAASFKPTKMPAFKPTYSTKPRSSTVPALRDMPSF